MFRLCGLVYDLVYRFSRCLLNILVLLVWDLMKCLRKKCFLLVIRVFVRWLLVVKKLKC